MNRKIFLNGAWADNRIRIHILRSRSCFWSKSDPRTRHTYTSFRIAREES